MLNIQYHTVDGKKSYVLEKLSYINNLWHTLDSNLTFKDHMMLHKK